MTDYMGRIIPNGTLDIETLYQELENNPATGAFTSFIGVVREISDKSEKKVIGIEVEAWEEKASEKMDAIANEIGNKYKLLGFRLIHVEGMLKIGDPIVYILISSIHRKEAFAAMEEAIDRYKQESPVWKKEIYADDTSKWITTAK